MMQIRRSSRPAGLLATLMAVMLLAACASNPGGPQQLAGPPGGPGGPGGPATPGSPQDFTVNVGDRVYFETDSSELTMQARATLDRQAVWLNQYPRYAITIEGHADERGTREYNIALGARRAAATRAYLAQRGVPAERLRTLSFGKERPVAVCNDISCWSQNRRAVTTVAGG
jgi:peptidoglycan-associated lipoprotein